MRVITPDAMLRRTFGRMASKKGTLIVLICLACIMLVELVYYQYKINNSALPKLKNYISTFIYDKVNNGSSYEKKHKSSSVGRPPSAPVLVGTNFVFDEIEWKQRFGKVKYVLVVPHGLQWTKQSNVRKKLRPVDYKSVQRLINFLDSSDEFQAATCEREICDGTRCKAPKLATKSACRFIIQSWTMVIQNIGKLKTFRDHNGREIYGYECNIVQTAFVIRKEEFLKLKLKTHYGENTLRDFFLRSKGRLKIAKLSHCALSDDMNHQDRGYLEDIKEFPDYSLFGRDNKILRLIMQDKIIWTKCTTDKTLCPEKPLVRPQTLQSAVLPICCTRVMNEMLIDSVRALQKLGMDYRLAYGTALGAVRSQSVIPWTHDIDIAIKMADFKNKTLFKSLQNVFGKKYYVGNYERNLRAIAHYPARLDYDTSKLYSGETIKDIVFSGDVIKAMRRLLPIKNNWQSRCYVDLYATYPQFAYRFDSSSKVVVNGKEYLTVANVTGELRRWYGANYMTPVVKMSAPREDIKKPKTGKRRTNKRKGRKRGKGRKKEHRKPRSKRTKKNAVNS